MTTSSSSSTGTRINGIVLGYEDLNDHDRLRLDPVHALLAGKDDLTGEERAKEADRGERRSIVWSWEPVGAISVIVRSCR